MIIDQKALDDYNKFLERRTYSEKYKKNLKGYAKQWFGKDFNKDTMVTAILLVDKANRINHRTKFYRAFLRTFIDGLKIPDIDKGSLKWSGKVREPDIIYYTMEEMNKIRIGVTDTRLWLIIHLMGTKGLRINEVMEIKKKDIDLTNKRIRGHGKGGKAFNIPIHDMIYPKLSEYISHIHTDYVLKWEGIGYQEKKAWYEIKKAIKDILPYKGKEEITCHAFRRSYGTNLVKGGMNLRKVQKRLRHKNLQTTARYVEVDNTESEEEEEKIMDKMYGE